MKISGQQRLEAGRDEVWLALNDPTVLANTLPGLQRLSVAEPDTYDVMLTVGVGAIKGTYAGTFAFFDKQEPEACSIRAAASGSQGSVEAVAHVRLAADPEGGTTVTYEADTAVTGPVAGVGQRMIGAAAKRTTKDFFSALEREISGRGELEDRAGGLRTERAGAPTEQPISTYIEPHAKAATEARRVDLGSLLLGAGLALVAVVAGRWSARR